MAEDRRYTIGELWAELGRFEEAGRFQVQLDAEAVQGRPQELRAAAAARTTPVSVG
jgi:hypothetical protein